MKMNDNQTKQVKRFLQWVARSQPTQKELESAMIRTGLDVASVALQVYVDKVSTNLHAHVLTHSKGM